MKTKLDKNGICLATFDKDTVADFNLIAFGDVYLPLVNLSENFKDGEAQSEHISVLKNYRRRGLANEKKNTFTIYDSFSIQYLTS